MSRRATLYWIVVGIFALLYAVSELPPEDDADKRTQLDKQDAIRAASITKGTP